MSVRKRIWQLCKTKQYRLSHVTLIATVLMAIIITPSILQSTLSTATNLPQTNTTEDDNSNSEYSSNNSFTLVRSNQSSLFDKTNVTLRGLFTDLANPGRWTQLLQPALDELNRRHPDMNIQIEYQDFPYNVTRNQLMNRLSNDNNNNNNNSVDLVSVDQIWLGEFAELGLLRNLTDEFEKWGRMSDLYEANIDGSVYNNTIYGLWLWTDVRGMWYWKDMLQEAGVDPESLKTWDGYISVAVQLDEFFGDKIIEGVHLRNAPHEPDMWYPYLWMLGGDILELREGHPTKGVYWFPSYNSSEGVRALEFLKRQVDAGIEPQERQLERAFANKNFSVMLADSAMPGYFPKESLATLKQELGFIPMFPVPNQTILTSTMMGGWELAVPSTSQHSDLSWELITIMAEPEILTPFLQEYGYLPTQKMIGYGQLSEPLNDTVPFFEEMISMIPYGRSRPNIPEYPQIAEHITQAIQQVYNGSALPEDALNIAASRSAASLGWDTTQ